MQQTLASSLIARNPVFRNFLAASTVSLLGTSIFDIAMPLYVLQRTHSAVALAAANIALHLPYFLMAPLTGYSADNLDKRRVMLFSDLGQVICLAFLLTYELVSAESLWPILVAVFVTKSLMLMFETVATFQLIPALVPSQDLSAANTWFLSSHRFIQIFGPVTGGILMSVFGVRSCIVVNLVSFAATLYFVYRVKNLNEIIDGEDVTFRPPTLKNMLANFTDSITYIWSSSLFRPFVYLMFFWNLASLNPQTPSLTYYFTETKHFSEAEYGLVISLCGVLGIAGYFAASSIYGRLDFYRTFVGSTLWQALFASFSLVFIHYPILFALVFAISRVGSSGLTMGSFLLRQTEIPRSIVGGVNACIRMFFMIAVPLSAVIQAFLIERIGVHASFIFGAVCLWLTLACAKKVALAYASRPHAVPVGSAGEEAAA